MSAFIIVSLTPRDTEKLKAYSAAAGGTVQQHSGKFVARGPVEVLTGQMHHKMQAVIAFPSREEALRWYQSAEYQSLIPLRDEAMDCDFTLVG